MTSKTARIIDEYEIYRKKMDSKKYEDFHAMSEKAKELDKIERNTERRRKPKPKPYSLPQKKKEDIITVSDSDSETEIDAAEESAPFEEPRTLVRLFGVWIDIKTHQKCIPRVTDTLKYSPD